MTVIIDDSDKELYLLAKRIQDSGFENVDVETAVLVNILQEKGRKIAVYAEENTENVYISFPKKKRFGIF